MIHDPRWDAVSDADWDTFARCWVAEISGAATVPLPPLPVLFEDEPPKTAGEFVVPMSFTASSNAQWKFIKAAFEHADDEALFHLAAGPVEHILGHHGEDYIERFERWARECPRFAQMLRGCLKYMMTDEIWARICAVRDQETS